MYSCTKYHVPHYFQRKQILKHESQDVDLTKTWLFRKGHGFAERTLDSQVWVNGNVRCSFDLLQYQGDPRNISMKYWKYISIFQGRADDLNALWKGQFFGLCQSSTNEVIYFSNQYN